MLLANNIGYFAVLYLICEPLLLRPLYERYRAQLEYKLTLCNFLHWADLQAPGGTLAAIYITLRRYFTTPPHPRLTGLDTVMTSYKTRSTVPPTRAPTL